MQYTNPDAFLGLLDIVHIANCFCFRWNSSPSNFILPICHSGIPSCSSFGCHTHIILCSSYYFQTFLVYKVHTTMSIGFLQRNTCIFFLKCLWYEMELRPQFGYLKALHSDSDMAIIHNTSK